MVGVLINVMGVLISVLGGTNKRDGGIHKHDEGASKRNEVRDRRRYMYQMKAKRKGPWHANKEGTEPGPGPWSTWAGTRFMHSCSNMYPQRVHRGNKSTGFTESCSVWECKEIETPFGSTRIDSMFFHQW